MTTRRRFLEVVAVGGAWACGQPKLGTVLEAPVAEVDGGSAFDAGELDAGVDAGVDAGAEDAGRPVESPEGWTESSNFAFGIASGDVLVDRVILGTRYDGHSPLRLVVWRMEGTSYAELVADVALTAGDGGFVQLEVQQLVAGERYRYAFIEQVGTLRQRSAIGWFRAALAPGRSEPLVFGACSCTSTGSAAPLLHAGSRDDLTAFLLLGDTSYNDGADTQAEYRQKWAASLSREAYRRLRASTSIVATWDDHEVDNNFNPETISATKLQAARAAFFEALPFRRSTVDPNRLWRSFRWGDAVELFVLDTRGERKPSTLLTANQELVSPAQLAWLQSALMASPCRIKLIMNSVPITDFGFSAFNTDAWVVYRKQRLELLQFIDDQRLTGVLWVSGDHHFASAGRVAPSGVGSRALEVLVGPGAQTANQLFRLLSTPRWDFASGENNYAVFHCDPSRGEVRVVFHDGQGAVLFDKTYSV